MKIEVYKTSPATTCVNPSAPASSVFALPDILNSGGGGD